MTTDVTEPCPRCKRPRRLVFGDEICADSVGTMCAPRAVEPEIRGSNATLVPSDELARIKAERASALSDVEALKREILAVARQAAETMRATEAEQAREERKRCVAWVNWMLAYQFGTAEQYIRPGTFLRTFIDGVWTGLPAPDVEAFAP